MDSHVDPAQDSPSMVGFAPSPRRGWWSRNWLWFVPTCLLGMVLLCGGGALLVVNFAVGKIRGSEPYVMAIKELQTNPAARQVLGEPIEDTSFMPAGEIHLANDRGEALLFFDVEGPKGTGKVQLRARRTSGRWELVLLELSLNKTGEKISLLSDEGGLDDAPPFNPGTP